MRCGACETPELWCGAAGLYARVRACAGAAESLYAYGCISMHRYWSSLLRYCPRDCFCWLPIFVVIQLPPTRAQFLLLCWCGLSRAGFLSFPPPFPCRVSISQSTGILGIPLPALLSNTYIPSRAKTASTPFVAKCLRVYARVLVPPNLYIHTYIQYIYITYYLGFNRMCWCRRIFTYIHTYSIYIARTTSGLTACAGAAESLHIYIHTVHI